jgi:hypothetical protein
MSLGAAIRDREAAGTLRQIHLYPSSSDAGRWQASHENPDGSFRVHISDCPVTALCEALRRTPTEIDAPALCGPTNQIATERDETGSHDQLTLEEMLG